MPSGGRRLRSGSPPKPTALKVLEGNPGRRPLNDHEPKPKLAIPPCPRELGQDARKEWRRVTPELHKLGLLSHIDRAALSAYCAAWGVWISAEREVRQSGVLVRDPDDGQVKEHPIMRVRDKAERSMHRFLIEFGMTPAARSRIQVEPELLAGDGREMAPDEAFFSKRLKLVK